MTELEWNIKHKREKMIRQQQIMWRVIFVTFLIIAFGFGFIYGMVTEIASAEEFVKPDLWVGASQEDFSYSVVVEPEEIEEVSDSEEEHIEEDWIYEKSEAEILASAIYYEAGCLSRECKLYVASVIVNRIESKNHDFKNVDTIKEVICQKGQYSTKNKILKIGKYTDEDMEVAMQILQYGSYDPKPLYQHYKKKVKGTTFYKKIDTEVFSY